jgi:hypothetical protein
MLGHFSSQEPLIDLLFKNNTTPTSNWKNIQNTNKKHYSDFDIGT